MRFLLLSLAVSTIATAAPVPRGTELEVRLKGKVSSITSRAGDKIEAVVIAPVLVNGHYRISPGALLAGQIDSVTQPSVQTERAGILLNFATLAAPGGKPVAVKGRVVQVDNAREHVDDTGKIVGILSSETLSAKIDQAIGRVSSRRSGLGGFLGTVKGAVLNRSEGVIEYEAGTELTFRLLEPVQWEAAAEPPQLRPIPDEDALFDFVNAQPFQTVAQNPPKPSDMTNLMFIGTEEAVRRAFTEAGWTIAEDLSHATALETFRAIAELRGYKEAPMSVLLLEGEAPVMNYQKTLNTFAKRHHLRVFRRPGVWDAKPIWVSSSTHDIGIEFSEQNRTFIHKIDPRIDRERAKVVTDLMFTGRVKSVALVDRPNVPRRSQNATGDDLITDGAMAVLVIE